MGTPYEFNIGLPQNSSHKIGSLKIALFEIAALKTLPLCGQAALRHKGA